MSTSDTLPVVLRRSPRQHRPSLSLISFQRALPGHGEWLHSFVDRHRLPDSQRPPRPSSGSPEHPGAADLAGILSTAGHCDQSSAAMTDLLRCSLWNSLAVMQAHAAPRSPSSVRSQPAIWFQLARMRSPNKPRLNAVAATDCRATISSHERAFTILVGRGSKMRSARGSGARKASDGRRSIEPLPSY